MFTMPVETAPRLLFLFFLLLASIIVLITIGIYWKVIIDTFREKYRALKSRPET